MLQFLWNNFYGNFEIGKYIEKLANRYNERFIRWQKIFAEEKSEQPTKTLKAIDNQLYEIETCIEKLKKIENILKNEKSFFKPIKISKDEMDKFEKEKLKKEIEMKKKKTVGMTGIIGWLCSQTHKSRK